MTGGTDPVADAAVAASGLVHAWKAQRTDSALAAMGAALDRVVDAARDALPPWMPCPCCENYWCNIHAKHAYECNCPPVEEWECSPYQPRA